MSKKKKKMKEEADYDFDPFFSKKAKMEVNIDEVGISFVGNAEGYLSMSRFFTYLAEVHTSIREESPQSEDVNTVRGYGAYHFKDYINEEKIMKGDYLFNPGPISKLKSNNHEQDVLFWLSDVTGPAFWKEELDAKKKEK